MARKFHGYQRNSRPNLSAFTVLELLLVLMVVTVLLGIAVPGLRLVTRERAIREAARVVGSTISKARDEAAIDKSAGVLLRRNPNFVDDGTWFASTELGILRAVPDYVGDQVYVKGEFPSLGANRISGSQVEIPYPIEQESSSPVAVGDLISLNNSSAKFEITKVEMEESDDGAAVLRLTLDVGDLYPRIPPKFEDVPFVVQRRPRLQRSSLRELPGSTLIDLRFSGIDPVFEPVVQDLDPDFKNYEIEILFERGGYLSRILYWELSAGNQRTGRKVTRKSTASMFLLITEAALSDDSFPLADTGFWVKTKFHPASPTVQETVRLADRPMSRINPDSIGALAVEARAGIPQEANP